MTVFKNKCECCLSLAIYLPFNLAQLPKSPSCLENYNELLYRFNSIQTTARFLNLYKPIDFTPFFENIQRGLFRALCDSYKRPSHISESGSQQM